VFNADNLKRSGKFFFQAKKAFNLSVWGRFKDGERRRDVVPPPHQNFHTLLFPRFKGRRRRLDAVRPQIVQTLIFSSFSRFITNYFKKSLKNWKKS